MKVISTKRLTLRLWQPEDAERFYQLSQDPLVQKFIPFPVSREKATQLVADMNDCFAKHHYTLWIVEEKASKAFMGYVGLSPVSPSMPYAPGPEIGWRFASPFWGKGYATEAAQACLNYVFTKLDLQEVVALTNPSNTRSLRVMEKLGMHYVAGHDFLHPKLDPTHPLALFVVYKITRTTFLKNNH